jgi:2-polyprenyl-3-methyl-5-hydroxy-6-metoxy-1,4-benzoquinol methylase
MFNLLIYYIKKVLFKLSKKEQFVGTYAYRKYLFEELINTFGRDQFKGKRFLEIGPKDGEDTERLHSLNPKEFIMFDLPDKSEQNEKWKDNLQKTDKLYIKNFLYLSNKEYEDLEKFDLIYFTGVLYHNPEQLRFIKKLYDKLNDNGVLVLESATIRNYALRKTNVVQVFYPTTYRNTTTITHLPSKHAIKSWLNMVGFQKIIDSNCFKPENYNVQSNRYACLAQKLNSDKEAVYYDKQIENSPYVIGGSS